MNSASLSLARRPGIVASERGDRAELLLKRCLDITLCVIALPFLGPLLLLIALAIVTDSPGSFIFSQDRVGARLCVKEGREVWEIRIFRMHKFRSMVQNADQTLHQEYIKSFVRGDVTESADANAQFKLVHDPRITRVGRFLRRTSLDELPQLFNVLKGEMSLVGPRPVPIYEVAEYSEPHFERLAALPGLTGLWQVTSRGNSTFEEMVQLDIEYVRNRNLWLDIQLLVRTIPAVWGGRGAR